MRRFPGLFFDLISSMAAFVCVKHPKETMAKISSRRVTYLQEITNQYLYDLTTNDLVGGYFVMKTTKYHYTPHSYKRNNLHTHTHTHTYIYMYIYIYIYIYMRVYMCVCKCIHTHTHTHIYI